ncbi:MAG: glycosyltransferase [Saccharofermentans sp.]|nr:glycosyltransferase [Saccharofermentans sp.]
MSEAKRILIAGFTSEVGGMESYVMNLYRHVDREKLQFDFVNNLNTQIAYADEIVKLGGKVFNIPIIRNGFVEHYNALNRLFSNTKYEAVYYQANRKLKNADLFRYAKKYGVPHRILHSHNTQQLDEGRVDMIRAAYAKKQLARLVTDYFACSKEAGEWMFPGVSNVVVVKNGVDTDLFDYNKSIASSIRLREGVGERKIYGTVGRLCAEKNSLFLVDIFAEIHKRDKDAVFWHIGGGGLESEMREKIRMYNLEDSYFLLGRKENVSDYLNAMDLLLLPSEHEGFPITLVEAQCSGLHCLISENITQSVDISGNVSFKSLGASADEWAIEAIYLSSYQRESCKEILINRGYDESRIADWFVSFMIGEGE